MIPPKLVVLPTVSQTSILVDAVHPFPGNLAQMMDGLCTVFVLALHW
jgi:hypothetical protein